MRKMVIVSLDAMFDEDWKALPPSSPLKILLDQGATCTGVQTVFPSLTYPAHVTLQTGCNPAGHGIGQNKPFQPEVEPRMHAWYWDSRKIQRETLFDAVKKRGGTCASILWPVTGKNPSIRWNFPEVAALPGENQVLKMLCYGTPLWILHMEMKYGKTRPAVEEPYLSDYATRLTCDVIRHHQPDLTCVHFVDVDDMRHLHGVHAPEVTEAIHRMEKRVSEIHRTMQETPGMEDALLVLVSDHGQEDIQRTVALNPWLKEKGLQDAVQAQSCGMSAYLFPGTAGEEAIAHAEEVFRKEGASIGAARVFSRKELDQMRCIPGPAFAIDGAPGVAFSDDLPQGKRAKATHGYGPDHAATQCLLSVIGRGIQPGSLPERMVMRDVAPTLAHLLGVSLPQAEGFSRW